ncbi:MAG: DUF1844 domain-containing protein [Candidatus Eisenbacteria bacterium]
MDDSKPDIHTIRFFALVDSFYGAARTFLGDAGGPEEGEREPELVKAQAYIDFLATIRVKTEDNLSKTEEEHLDRLLSDLRLRYVEALEAAKGAGEERKGEGRAGTPEEGTEDR